MYRGRKTHFGRNYFAKNIILLKKQQKRRYDMRTHHTAYGYLLYPFRFTFAHKSFWNRFYSRFGIVSLFHCESITNRRVFRNKKEPLKLSGSH